MVETVPISRKSTIGQLEGHFEITRGKKWKGDEHHKKSCIKLGPVTGSKTGSQ